MNKPLYILQHEDQDGMLLIDIIVDPIKAKQKLESLFQMNILANVTGYTWEGDNYRSVGTVGQISKVTGQNTSIKWYLQSTPEITKNIFLG